MPMKQIINLWTPLHFQEMKSGNIAKIFSSKQLIIAQSDSVSFKSEKQPKNDNKEGEKLQRQLQYQDSRHQISSINLKTNASLLEKENYMLKLQLEKQQPTQLKHSEERSTSNSFMHNLMETHKMPDKPCLPEPPSFISTHGLQPQCITDMAEQAKKDKDLIQTYKLQIQQLNDKNQKLQKELRLKKDILQELEQKGQLNGALNKQISSMQRRNGEGSARIAELQGQLKARDIEIEALQEQVEHYKKSLKHFEEKQQKVIMKKHETEVTQLKQQLQQSEEAQNALRQKNLELVNQVETMQTTQKLKQSQIMTESTQNNEYKEQNKELKNKVNELTKKLNEAEAAAQTLQQLLDLNNNESEQMCDQFEKQINLMENRNQSYKNQTKILFAIVLCISVALFTLLFKQR